MIISKQSPCLYLSLKIFFILSFISLCLSEVWGLSEQLGGSLAVCHCQSTKKAKTFLKYKICFVVVCKISWNMFCRGQVVKCLLFSISGWRRRLLSWKKMKSQQINLQVISTSFFSVICCQIVIFDYFSFHSDSLSDSNFIWILSHTYFLSSSWWTLPSCLMNLFFDVFFTKWRSNFTPFTTVFFPLCSQCWFLAKGQYSLSFEKLSGGTNCLSGHWTSNILCPS